MPATTKVVERTPRTLMEQIYYPEVLKGLGVTMGRFFRNTFGREETVTVEYPEVRRPHPARYRGHHYLTVRFDGSVACVACMLCPTICPAACIHIEAAEHPDPSIEKYPVRFEIDLLRCIYCGLCEEACPKDAIRMTSGIHPVPHTDRPSFRVGLDRLVDPSKTTRCDHGPERPGTPFD
jgi:NADH-quinone oxidoreductase subunit I